MCTVYPFSLHDPALCDSDAIDPYSATYIRAVHAR